jgi:hypothetical protein
MQAQERAKPDASAIYVPGNQTAKAIEEAIEAEIPLVVAVAEHVPIHDMLRVSTSLDREHFLFIYLTSVGSLYAADPVQNATGRSQLPRDHLCNWQVPYRVPTFTVFFAWEDRNRG